ncbi:LptA/OstA family protein [Desulfobotulus mexicanus]|nr:LptA/OstA family protein [Desulfobotulus mexicanus]
MFCFFYPFNLSADSSPSIHFESRQQTWDTKSRKILMEGEAKISGNHESLEAEKIHIFFYPMDTGKQLSAESLKSLKAEGKVRLSSEDIHATADTALYESQTQKLLLEGFPAEILHTDLHIRGNIIRFDRIQNQMEVEGSQETPTTLRETATESVETSPMAARAMMQHWDLNAKILILHDKVHMSQAEMNIMADTMTLYYRSEEKKEHETDHTPPGIEKAIAKGHVRLTHADGHALGEKAVYTSTDEIIILTGNPARMERDGNILQGPEIRFNRRTGEIEISGGASGSLFPGSDAAPF